MKVTPRTPADLALRHAVAFHDSAADLFTRSVRLTREALERGDLVALALPPDVEQAVHAAVGTAGLVTLAPAVPPLSPVSGAAEGSGQTTAALRGRELRMLSRDHPGLTVLTAHDERLDGADGAYWTELDAALNVAVADLDVTLVCSFPSYPLHLEVLEGARANHALLLTGGGLRPNPDHECPAEVLRTRPAQSPIVLGPPDLRLTYNSWQLHDVRGALETAVGLVGFETARGEDLVLAVNEVATNAVEHGTADAELYLWASPTELVCEVHDGGILREPLPGLKAPHPKDPRGRGVWIARQLCDLLHVWRDGSGTHVRMHARP
ncbi:MAG: sensor histidine kinase [Pseudonocardia sp.]|nr:sensor histidine kinase [Pseudonocardia sp.]